MKFKITVVHEMTYEPEKENYDPDMVWCPKMVEATERASFDENPEYLESFQTTPTITFELLEE